MASSVRTGRAALLLLLLGLCALGCGRRTILAADADRDDDEARDGGAMVYPCGRGKRPCDPDNLGGKTCESLGLEGGELSCNTSTCNLDLSGCTGLPVGVGQSGRTGAGAGAGGAPGLFGSTAGTPATGGLFGTGAAGTGTAFFGGTNTGDGGTAFFGGTAQGDGGTPFFGGGTADGGTPFFGGGNADGGAFFGGGAN